jgi:PST family polysaccharide transporter
MSPLRAVAYSAVATLAKMAGALAAIKGVAWFLGPAGLGQLGYFINAIALLAILVSGGAALGITRFVAERRETPESLERLLRAVACVAVGCVTLLGLAGLLGAPGLADWLLGDAAHWPVIVATCALLPVLAVGSIGLAVVNGFGDTRALAWIQGGAALLGAGVAVTAAWAWGLPGAAAGLAWASSCHALLIALWWRAQPALRARYWRPAWHAPELWQLSSYAWIFAFTTVLQNALQFTLRGMVEVQAGIAQAGLWQAVSRLSDAHLQLFFVFCATSLLPRVARAGTRAEVDAVIGSTLRIVVIAVCGTTAAMILLRDSLLLLLYSREFLPGADYVVPQALGDALRVVSFVSGYYLIARRKVALLLAGDLVQAALYFGLAGVFVTRGGAEGACWAYAVTYALYLPLAWHFLRRTARDEPGGPAQTAATSLSPETSPP